MSLAAVLARLFAADKLQHMLAGMVLFAFVMALQATPLAALLAVAVIACGKELVDAQGTGAPSVLDAAVTIAPAFFGWLVLS